MGHKTINIKCKLTKRYYNIDEEIAALVICVWNQGVKTTGSCQGGEGSDCIPEGCAEPASISFGSLEDTEWFWNQIKDKRWDLILSQDRTKGGWTVHFAPNKIKAVRRIINNET